MPTRRGFVWLCGASTAAILTSKTGLRSQAKHHCRTTATMSSTTMRELAEQTRIALVALTPSEGKELRKRFGIG
jgi:hypothetical protein